MRQTISFLLGSGFSIPEQLPGVRQLNERLRAIDESEILIHSEMSAIFLNGQHDPNRGMNKHERLFVQEFLKFYSSEVLKQGEPFHYETFYDYYSDFLRDIANQDAINGFVDRFNKDFAGVRAKDGRNWIKDFNRTFNQLVASQLQRAHYYNDVSYSDHPPYDAFLDFLRQLIKQADVKIHTLNHDMFFEFLGRKHSGLWEHFSDGFSLAGSPYFGEVEFTFDPNGNRVRKHYYVRLERFINYFDRPLCLFKLHGSVSTHVVYPPGGGIERIKRDYGMGKFFIELYNEETKEYKTEWLWNEVDPDFLSGTTEKTRRYGDHYYVEQFQHFEKNLADSDLLIVIGYGFQDGGINEYLEKNYLSRGKKMVVIDPYKPQSDLLEKYPFEYIPKGITEVTPDEFKPLILV